MIAILQKFQNRWLILAAMFVMNICIGSLLSWSVYQKPLIDLFGWSTSATSLNFSIMIFIESLAMIVGGKLQSRLGAQRLMFIGGIVYSVGVIATGFTNSLLFLYTTYGVLGGIGVGLIYGTSIANGVKWFPDKRGLASGLVVAGFGLGSMIDAPLSNALIEQYGVLTTFKILGVAYFLLISAASWWVTEAPANYRPASWRPSTIRSNQGTDKDWQEMLRDPIFYSIWITYAAACTSGLMIIGHASPIIQEVIGLDAGTAAIAVSIMALSNMVGRVAWGSISDRLGQYFTLVTMLVLSAMMMVIINYVHSFGTFLAVIMVIAVCYGGFLAIFPALTANLFGSKNLSTNYGLVFTAFGIAAFIGPHLAARVKEINNGDYTVAFIMAALINTIAIVLTVHVRHKLT